MEALEKIVAVEEKAKVRVSAEHIFSISVFALHPPHRASAVSAL